MDRPGKTGDPANAVVQRSVATTMANVDTDICNIVPIAPITLAPGQIFYVGAISRGPRRRVSSEPSTAVLLLVCFGFGCGARPLARRPGTRAGARGACR